MSNSVFIGTIEKFPLHALRCLLKDDMRGLDDEAQAAVADLKSQHRASHEGVRYEQIAADIAHTDTPEFGAPCEALSVDVWGRPIDVVSIEE
tara:strand:+ start:298 stop:573 length:276 start_codon:yes stop_codon:yes gene_type:complete